MNYLRTALRMSLAVHLVSSCMCSNVSPKRLSREAVTSNLHIEIRQLHAKQSFGSVVIKGNNLSEVFDAWFHAVYDIAPMVDKTMNMKMIPSGLIRGVAQGAHQSQFDLNGISPLESLNNICKEYNAYFKYDSDYSVIVSSDLSSLDSKPSDSGLATDRDPFQTTK